MSGNHNSGRRAMPLALHTLRGTAPRQARVGVSPQGPSGAPVPADLVEGLTGRGLAFVRTCWATYAGWTPASRVLLREAGQLIEQLESSRGQRGERAAQRLLLSTLAALHLQQ